ncbi:MAG: flagellin [Peptoclostridium sp.]|uniref:flagellin N-terminal helical domain-containing protein n=1 Tax=Peptoclostridium sp. TaxID=1904860 RepID=UPI00139C553F|nr:flagellin [Peptoclostridium sp.]MZQ74609.1 flagellin [Peptoclostridium sp.]
MIINHNMNAMNAHRMMSGNTNAAGKSMEKLSSGLRINRAGDDAAGLAISEKMRGQIRGLDQAGRNAQDGISMIQTAEGALNETHSILQRMREISVQASNDTNTADDRKAIGDELVQLKNEIDRISDTTAFNGKKLLNGDLSTALDAASTAKTGVAITGGTISDVDVSKAMAGKTYTLSYTSGTDTLTLTRSGDNAAQSITLTALADQKTISFDTLGVSFELTGTQATVDTLGGDLDTKTIVTAAGSSAASLLIGSNGTADETLSVDFKKMDSTTLGSGVGSYISDKISDNTAVDTKAKADALITVLDNAIKGVSEQRSSLGAAQNRLEHTIANLGTSSENLTAAESRVRDVDMAKEMMSFSKNNILSQAAQAMLAQANQQPQGVLQLLR